MGNQKECFHDIPQNSKDWISFFAEHSTLPLAESEVIIDIFKYCVNINENLLGQRDIEIGTNATASSRGDTDVVMEETLVARVTGHLGSISFTDLIHLKGKIQMNT